MRIRPVESGDQAEWLRMRASLWPASTEIHEREMEKIRSSVSNESIVIVADREDGRLGGFLEARARPYAEGCTSSPVGYIEGWWVDPDLRRTGVGGRMVAAAEAWSRSLGLTEMASDSELGNTASEAAHRALGYQEVVRVVCFRKRL